MHASRNEIGLDKIQERLGNMKTSMPPDVWNTVSDVGAASKTTLSGVSFVLFAAVAFLTVGVVTYFLLGEGIPDFGF